MPFTGQANVDMDVIKSRIRRLSSTGEPQEEFILANIEEWGASEARNLMLMGQQYYANDNDIVDRVRYYIDRYGTQREAKNVSNSRLPHPFMRKLTNQKVNYLLSKELSIHCDDEEFSEVVGTYIDKSFLRMLKTVGRDAIVNGIAWVQVYYNEIGQLRFKRIPSLEVIPFWADADHTILDAVVRTYTIQQYLEDGVVEEVDKIEYHTSEGVWYYILDDGKLKPDEERGDPPSGHFVIQGETEMESGEMALQEIQATWERIPFIAFKYNPDETSLIKWIKPLIDDYDINTSDTSNNLQDVPNSIKVVKNYDGTDKGEFSQNLATFRTAFVTGDGDMKSVETRMDVAAIEAHLDRLRKDIYAAGSGVDTQEASLGNAASGVALKFRYVDLDNDTDDMAGEFAAGIQELMWFAKVDLLNKGGGDFLDVDFDVIFNTDNIINEAEAILSGRNSMGVISDETIVANHPWVTDTSREMQRIRDQRAGELDYLSGPAEPFGVIDEEEA